MNNQTRLDGSLEWGLVTHVGAPFWSMPGFAIPIIQSTCGSNATYVQSCDVFGKVTGFRLIEHGHGNLSEIIEPLKVRLGDEEVYGIIDPYGNAVAGSQKKLSNLVRGWLPLVKEPVGRLTFARFCGDRKAEILSARNIISKKKSEFNSENRAIEWFIYSTFSRDLINIVDSRITSTRSGDLYDRIPQMKIEIGRNSIIIKLEISNNGKGITYKTRRYQNKMARTFKLIREVSGRSVDFLAISRDFNPRAKVPAATVRAEIILDTIKSFGRQEDRLAYAFEQAVINSNTMLLALDKYHEPARYAANSLKMLGYALREKSDGHLLDRLNEVLRRSIIEAYPLQRGRLLLSLASRLSFEERLAATIRHHTLRSQARDIAALRDQILDKLDT